MRSVVFQPTFEDWQRAARGLLQENRPPEEIYWQEADDEQGALELFENETRTANAQIERSKYSVPKTFLELAKAASLHSNQGKWALVYRVLWRLTHGESKLLEIPSDADVIALTHLEKEVSKDAYRMRAFLRFRETKNRF